MTWKVFVTRRIPEKGLEILKRETDLEINPENCVLSHDDLLSKVKGKNGIVTLLTDKIDKSVLDAAGQDLRVISNYAVGYDNIDVKEATARRIVVTNTPGILTETTADLTWALILCIARRIVEADTFSRSEKFKSWAPLLLLGSDVYGKTLGIIGFGRIGKAVYERSTGFSMKVLVYHPRFREPFQYPNAELVSFEDLLKKSDFVTLHTPLTSETRHLIGEKELKMMKPSAYLINTSRGPVVDESALAAALKEGRIAGAALDVYEEEPRIHPDLMNLPNVILLPHIGSASHETRDRMAVMAAENLLAVLRGEHPQNMVNPEIFS